LLEVAEENENVLKEPQPAVRLLKFEDSALYLELWAWSETQLHRKGVFTSDLNFAILKKFRENNIEIPFPQTDLHIRSGELKLRRNSLSIGDEVESVSENSN
jgi:small-conductance mechanosensitive channel